MPTHYKGDPKEVQALDTFIKFTRAANTFETRIFQHAAIEDLTPSQFGILETLYHLGPLCQSEVSAKLLKSTGNVTLVLDNLEKRGLVKRERGTKDRRIVQIYLTQVGEDQIRRIFPQMVSTIMDELSILTSEEQIELGRLCRIIGKNTRQ